MARRPQTDYVARLVGLNLLLGTAAGREVRLPGGGVIVTAGAIGAAGGTGTSGGPVFAAFRPAAVALYPSAPVGSPRNVWSGRVVGLEPVGESVRVEVGRIWDDHTSVVAEVTPEAVIDLDLSIGAEIWASVKASEVEVYQRE